MKTLKKLSNFYANALGSASLTHVNDDVDDMRQPYRDHRGKKVRDAVMEEDWSSKCGRKE